jgi:hypothetical protein
MRDSVNEAGDRASRLREIAGVVVGMTVQSIRVHSSGGPYPAGVPDLLLSRPPEASSFRGVGFGDVRLLVITHGWRLESRERVVAAPKDPLAGLGDAMGILAGRPVTGLEVEAPGPDTTIWFGDLRLRLFPVSCLPAPDGVPAWLLRTAPDFLVVVGPGGDWGISRRGRQAREART